MPVLMYHPWVFSCSDANWHRCNTNLFNADNACELLEAWLGDFRRGVRRCCHLPGPGSCLGFSGSFCTRGGSRTMEWLERINNRGATSAQPKQCLSPSCFLFLSVCHSSVIRSARIICVFIPNIIFPPVPHQLHCSRKGKRALFLCMVMNGCICSSNIGKGGRKDGKGEEEIRCCSLHCLCGEGRIQGLDFCSLGQVPRWCFGDWLSSHRAATRQLHTGLVGKQKKEQGLNPPALTPASPGLCLRPVLAVQEEEQGWRLQSSRADLLGLLPSLFLLREMPTGEGRGGREGG